MGLWRGIGSRKDATRGTAPIEVRKVLAGLFAPNDSGIGARSGILFNGSTAPLGTGDATWAYNVGLFHAYVSRSASDGGTVFGNDGSVLIGATGVGSTVPVAPGAGLQRIDVAWTRHPTAGENGDGATTVALASEPLFGVASGTAASSSPVAPTIPAGAFELFRNLMTSAATNTASAGNTITQSALYTAVRGAPVPCRNQAERDALPLFDGQRADRLDLHLVERYNGTAWVTGLPRVGASVNLTDSWATQATRTHAGTWSLGEDSGGFVGALTADTTPITIPAGEGGLYAVSLGFSNSAVMTTSGGFIQITIGGTLLTGSQSAYRVAMPISTSQGGIGVTLPLAAGCTLQIISGLTASAYAVTATMSCYRIGD